MSPIPEQEARASQTARELLKPVGFLLVSDRIEAIAIVARHLLAEREKLDGAESQLDAFRHRDETQLRSIKLIAEQRDAAETARDGARAAALREAAKLCRERAAYYGAPMPLSARTVVEKTAEACCLDLVDAIEALAANPQTTEEGPCELK